MVTTGPPLEVLNNVLDEVDGAKEELEGLLTRGADSSEAGDVYATLEDCARSIAEIRPILLEYSLKALEQGYNPRGAHPEKTAQDLVDRAMAGAGKEVFLAQFTRGRAGKGLPVIFLEALETTLDCTDVPGATVDREDEPYVIKGLVDCGVFSLQKLVDYVNGHSGILKVNYASDKPGMLLPKDAWTLVLNSGAAAAAKPLEPAGDPPPYH